MTYRAIEKQISDHLASIREAFGIVVMFQPETPSQWGSVAGPGYVVMRWESSSESPADFGGESI